MIKTTLAGALAAALLSLAACGSMDAAGGDAPAVTSNGILVTRAGMAVYTFDKDIAGSGVSVCNGPCAQLWPPLAAQAADKGRGDWTILDRTDGSRQWAYKGAPLYTYAKDAKAGDTSGDRFKDVWHVARP